ncbi:MAG: hypothetical protein EPO58_06535 [Chitinophagaceae bacterium]|nr:MAG: hypothetical protein EPO58_06535 [Chitinophagaceae bacterium]
MNEKNKQYIAIIQQSQILRGKFIDAFIDIEMNIDLFISNYFVQQKDKQTQFVTQVLDSRRLEFEKKIGIYSDILSYKQDNADVKKIFKTITNHISDLMEHRNIFAHAKIEIGTHGIEASKKGTLIFVKHDMKKGKPIGIVYSKEKIVELEKVLKLVIKKTRELALAS